MNKVIIYNIDGGVAIVRPTEESLEALGIEGIAAKDVPFGVPYAIVDASSIPTDRTFRNAWQSDDKAKIGVDVKKAKNIAHTKRRVMREQELLPLDKEVVISTASLNKVNEGEAKRQRIREKYAVMQESIDNATDIEELKRLLSVV